ncbi:type VI secretion system accessory protein TagJ [Erwinia sp. V90_4]|uniref:type VI secretion system accessory protein TagJ n=1 Tax=Erwinia sp. V90_4 TaxID=3044239 RepID=UPI00249DE003|nr:type VI secretion system accessory protein TagJ [Erwinia sp. V90_4]MDI3440024.1 type VI secretion system accessory protein TagJ [Erwinia sp. V90_4]
MHSLQQLMAGQSLNDTLAQVEGQIKQKPADADLRASFVQLLCLMGNWSRALTQLKSWRALKPQAQPTVTLLEQAIGGELKRARVFSGEDSPRMPGDGWSWAEQLLQALRADHRGDHAQAQALRAAAFDAAALNPGQLQRQGEEQAHAFDWLIDGDGRLGPLCELIVNGEYSWLPFSAISELRLQPPASVTDLVWRHTLVRLIDGSEQVCQIPARYPLAQDDDDRYRLGSLTEWRPLSACEQQFSGHGQKSWLSAQDDFPLLNLETLTFATAESAS